MLKRNTSALAVLRLITRSYLVGACRGRSPGFVPVFSVSRRSRHQPIGAALILFLKKHNNILSVYFSRLSSNCFPPYYIQPGRNILLLKIESSFQNQNKQKRLMSKLSCFARQRVIYDRGERSDTSMRDRFTPWFATVQPSLHGRVRIEVAPKCKQPRSRSATAPFRLGSALRLAERLSHFHLARSPRRR